MPRRKKRPLTPEESLEIISKYVADSYMMKNHTAAPVSLGTNTYRFTVNYISLDFLITLMEDSQVKNVFFNAAAAPPDSTIDSVSFRYKVYVEYHLK